MYLRELLLRRLYALYRLSDVLLRGGNEHVVLRLLVRDVVELLGPLLHLCLLRLQLAATDVINVVLNGSEACLQR